MIKKFLRCKCGSKMIFVDEHLICENYYQHIKEGIEQQQTLIEDIVG